MVDDTAPRRLRILIVDDSRMMRSYLRAALKELSGDVLECGSGDEALKTLERAGTFDLAVIDWHLPGMDGVSLVRELRKLRAHDGVRVLMITTEAEGDRIREALEAGAQEYLMKPFTPEMLQAKLSLLGIAGP